ncbi:MAG: purine-nucleoside phosphorylase [Actinomycetota bacterium]|nr:purine-nucleoside phosphorylase [Actinomycetota bacterium]
MASSVRENGSPSPSSQTSPDHQFPQEPKDLAREAAQRLAELTGVEEHRTALVLGSGWSHATERLGRTIAEFPATLLPGFTPPALSGHSGLIRSLLIGDGGHHALVLGSRTHLYEGRGVRAVAHGVRTAAAAGCRTLILTNGCGSLVPAWAPGTPVMIKDHINLTGTTPLEGATFIDMTEVYSPRLRELCRTAAPDLPEGVYVQFHGPQYETPAEVRMAGILGGHLVGMSTAIEAIAAREAGMEILGLSLVTNPAAGMGTEPLEHGEVVAEGQRAADRLGDLLSAVVRLL